MKAVKKPIEIDVRGPLLEREMVPTAHGYVAAEVGDFVITDPLTGDVWPIKPVFFYANYDITDKTLNQEVVFDNRPAMTELKEESKSD